MYAGSHFSIIENAMADTSKVRSFPILAYFLKNKLPNRVAIHFNAKEKDADSWIVYPVSEGKSLYRYYIPLTSPVDGYSRIVVSDRSAEYLKQFPERINELRIRCYPWPEVVLPYRVNKASFEEWDSIAHAMTRYSFKNGYVYDKDVPSYEKLFFDGFKRNPDFVMPEGEMCKEAYFFDPGCEY